MPYDLYYTMLFTDQGMGNLVSITDRGNTTDVQFSALIDFGSAHSSVTGDTVDFMESYIRANRASLKPGPDLDLVVVSHQDNDHWSLFPDLVGRFAGTTHPLTIGTLSFGGNFANYSAAAQTALTQLWNLAADRRQPPITQCSHYAAVSPLAVLAQFPAAAPEISFVPVICNVASMSSGKDIKANTVSMLVGVQWLYGGASQNMFLFPGDMTSCTIFALRTMKSRLAAIRNNYVLSLPHHGSHRTISDLYNAYAARTFDQATWFAGFIDPASLGVSAGFTTHRHPYNQVIQLFSAGVIDSGIPHNYIAYDPATPTNSGWRPYPGTRAIFTNYYVLPSAPQPKKRRRTMAPPKGRVVFKVNPGNPGSIEFSQLAVDSTPQPGLAE